MERMTVDVKVGKAIREFIIATSGSDVLDPDKYTILWCLIKQHLTTVPGHYKPLSDRSEYVSIKLRNSNDIKAYSVPKKGKSCYSTLFYSYLTETGQAVVRRHFEKEFKATFRNYMRGALNNNPDMKINDAIEEFLTDHDIAMDHISIAMLQKDWYRYRLKSTTRKVCPLCF